jgi:hypothetical protein
MKYIVPIIACLLIVGLINTPQEVAEARQNINVLPQSTLDCPNGFCPIKKIVEKQPVRSVVRQVVAPAVSVAPVAVPQSVLSSLPAGAVVTSYSDVVVSSEVVAPAAAFPIVRRIIDRQPVRTVVRRVVQAQPVRRVVRGGLRVAARVATAPVRLIRQLRCR